MKGRPPALTQMRALVIVRGLLNELLSSKPKLLATADNRPALTWQEPGIVVTVEPEEEGHGWIICASNRNHPIRRLDADRWTPGLLLPVTILWVLQPASA